MLVPAFVWANGLSDAAFFNQLERLEAAILRAVVALVLHARQVELEADRQKRQAPWILADAAPPRHVRVAATTDVPAAFDQLILWDLLERAHVGVQLRF